MSDKTYYYWQGVAKKSKSASGYIVFGVIAGSYEKMVDVCAKLFGSDEIGVTYFELTSVTEYWLPGLQFGAVAEAFTQFVKQEHEEEGK